MARTDCSATIAAVAKCSVCRRAAGTSSFRTGDYLTGPQIHLKSNVDLHLEKDATLKFTTDSKAYLPVVFTRFEGIECYNYSPLIYAHGQKNVAVTGEGTLDGQADETTWLAWKGRKGGSNNQNIAARPARQDER